MTVVVHDTEVSDHSRNERRDGSSSPAAGTGQVVQGTMQEPKFRDAFWAIIFCIMVAFFFLVALNKGLPYCQQDETCTKYMTNPFYHWLSSFIFSFISLVIMVEYPEDFVDWSLIFLFIPFSLALFSFLDGMKSWAIACLFFLFIPMYYIYAIKSKISFAKANLVTATMAVKGSDGIFYVALIFPILALVWAYLWTFSLIGLHVAWGSTCPTSNDSYGDDDQICPNFNICLGMLWPFFIGQQVLQNTVHVFTAGVVGKWWYSSEDSVWGSSLVRTMTTLFGSICFGSFFSIILSILQFFKQDPSCENCFCFAADCGVCLCLVQCMMEIVPKGWHQGAFVYVGHYGYSYLDARKKVLELFHSRGWEEVIKDDLVGHILMFVYVYVGFFTSFISLLGGYWSARFLYWFLELQHCDEYSW